MRIYNGLGIIFDGLNEVSLFELNVALFFPIISSIHLRWMVLIKLALCIEFRGFALVELTSCISVWKLRFIITALLFALIHFSLQILYWFPRNLYYLISIIIKLNKSIHIINNKVWKMANTKRIYWALNIREKRCLVDRLSLYLWSDFLIIYDSRAFGILLDHFEAGFFAWTVVLSN